MIILSKFVGILTKMEWLKKDITKNFMPKKMPISRCSSFEAKQDIELKFVFFSQYFMNIVICTKMIKICDGWLHDCAVLTWNGPFIIINNVVII